MRGLDSLEVDVLEDAAVILTEEDRELTATESERGDFDYSAAETAAARRMMARGNVIEDPHDEGYVLTSRGRIALSLARSGLSGGLAK